MPLGILLLVASLRFKNLFSPDEGGMGQSLDYSKVAFDLIDDLDGLTTVGKVMTRLGTTLVEFGTRLF
jgi:hypothetical protein